VGPRAGRTWVICLSGHRQTHTFSLIQRRGSAASARQSHSARRTRTCVSTPDLYRLGDVGENNIMSVIQSFDGTMQ
jgi:hypothetical protein